ncbi:Glucan endo-1,3-beta-glucosidase [Tolypocladium capitatum]|uniref:Glucan endo-1,3-beta-glucosidase n=1 Tax=Tolypocladium capitatum TaxID=45235 RepID=A0A2K3QNW8_9HYPO|nr:Glucan endo-1,3-beta-glucosidase [Tolypocladium capitatum]
MRSLTILAALLGAVSAAPTISPSGFTVATPGGIKDIIITKENTLNGTYHSPVTLVVKPDAKLASRAASGNLPIQFVNKLGGGQVYAYISGLDSDGRVVFIRGDNSLLYPSSGGSSVPAPFGQDPSIAMAGQGGTLQVTLPIVLKSARIYFSIGKLNFFMVKTPAGDGLVQPSAVNPSDPSSGTNWGFMEFTYGDDLSLFANISFVDFVGVAISLGLTVRNGGPTQTVRGLAANPVASICSAMVTQSNSDHFPWSRMCVANSAGQPLRVLSPNSYGVMNAGDFQNYWSGYIDQVWSFYSQNTLTVDTQTAPGKVQCRVSGNQLNCAGDNRGYGKPSASDIWGCNSGPFAIQGGDNGVHLAVVPRLCAAIHRSTLLIAGGNNQPGPSSTFYQGSPTDHYSRLLHQFEVDHDGYAFAYDDVTIAGENTAGVVTSGAPGIFTVYIGGPP